MMIVIGHLKLDSILERRHTIRARFILLYFNYDSIDTAVSYRIIPHRTLLFIAQCIIPN